MDLLTALIAVAGLSLSGITWIGGYLVGRPNQKATAKLTTAKVEDIEFAQLRSLNNDYRIDRDNERNRVNTLQERLDRLQDRSEKQIDRLHIDIRTCADENRAHQTRLTRVEEENVRLVARVETQNKRIEVLDHENKALRVRVEELLVSAIAKAEERAGEKDQAQVTLDQARTVTAQKPQLPAPGPALASVPETGTFKVTGELELEKGGR